MMLPGNCCRGERQASKTYQIDVLLIMYPPRSSAALLWSPLMPSLSQYRCCRCSLLGLLRIGRLGKLPLHNLPDTCEPLLRKQHNHGPFQDSPLLVCSPIP